jgi:hypothetical protein
MIVTLELPIMGRSSGFFASCCVHKRGKKALIKMKERENQAGAPAAWHCGAI